jgi:hypothetical protein
MTRVFLRNIIIVVGYVIGACLIGYAIGGRN